MKRYFILLSCVIAMLSCNSGKRSHSEVVNNYYQALNVSDFSHLKHLLADTITLVEGDFISSYSRGDFDAYFKWDSIFQPSYSIIKVKEHGNYVIADVALSSERFRFLKNNPLTCRYKISFDEGRIMKLETIEYKDADWDIWKNQRDSLVNWTSANHPELDGFIHDLTMKGAINYMKAIELFTNKNSGR